MRFKAGQTKRKIPIDTYRVNTAVWRASRSPYSYTVLLLPNQVFDQKAKWLTESGTPEYATVRVNALSHPEIQIAPAPDTGGDLRIRYTPNDREV